MVLIDCAPLLRLGGTIGVAVSGGRDSMALLHSLLVGGVPVVVLTVDHGIRGQRSREDAAFVVTYCTQNGIPVRMQEVDALGESARTHRGIEASARALRYAFFDKMLADGVVDYVATAHHQDDAIESTCMHLLRGCGLRGLVGIRSTPPYLRPLLGVTRADIDAYIMAHSIPYVEDETNTDTAYRRNWVRHELLPLISTQYPAYREALSRLSQVAEDQISFLDTMATKPIVLPDAVMLPLIALRGPIALAHHSIGLALAHFDGGVDYTAVHCDLIMGLADKPIGTEIDLPRIKVAVERGDALAFYCDTPRPHLHAPFAEGVWAGYRIGPYREGDTLRFDADRIPAGAVIRYREDGDQIAKFGGGTKSLGDFYTDRKIPRRLRDRTPVVAIGNQILVCIADISRDVAVTPASTRVYTMRKEDL